MKHTRVLSITILFISMATANIHVKNTAPTKQIGLFKSSDPQLHGIKYANWGSRPFEYYWAANVVEVKNKRVLDLGVGIPSQHAWYQYIIGTLSPDYYVGIDADGRMKNEEIHTNKYDMLNMDMSSLSFDDKTFDIAYCISTFEHIPYQIFMKSIQEVHRVLKDDGVLVLTLDEHWDKNLPLGHNNGWNDLEQSIMNTELCKTSHQSFGLPDFLNIVKEYFVPLTDDIAIDDNKKTVYSQKNGQIYYQRQNRDPDILRSQIMYNSCVSYAVLKKKS